MLSDRCVCVWQNMCVFPGVCTVWRCCRCCRWSHWPSAASGQIFHIIINPSVDGSGTLTCVCVSRSPSNSSSSFCTESKECLQFDLICRTHEYEVRRSDPLHYEFKRELNLNSCVRAGASLLVLALGLYGRWGVFPRRWRRHGLQTPLSLHIWSQWRGFVSAFIS